LYFVLSEFSAFKKKEGGGRGGGKIERGKGFFVGQNIHPKREQSYNRKNV